MSAKRIFSLAVFLSVFCIGEALSQDRSEKLTERSPCFSSKITFNITHSSAGQDNGAVSIELPQSAGEVKAYWIGYKTSIESNDISNLKPGKYSVMIVDKNNCSTKVTNIQVKEVP